MLTFASHKEPVTGSTFEFIFNDDRTSGKYNHLSPEHDRHDP